MANDPLRLARESVSVASETSEDRISKDHAAEHLTPAEVHEFQQLVKESCDIWLEDRDAWTRATQLIGLLRMFMRPLPEDPEVAAALVSSNVVSLDQIPNSALP